LVTNRHVTDEARNAPIRMPGMPTMMLQYTSYVFAQGAGADQQREAKLLHRSDKLDLAVLKADVQFSRPLRLGDQPPKQADSVYAWGYPGSVHDLLKRGSWTQQKQQAVEQEFMQTGRWDELATLPPDCFDPTVTKGIVSAEERHINGISHVQFDAMVSEGNSGGPLVDSAGEVVGIVTWGAKANKAYASYNFAISAAQLQEELAPFLRASRSGGP
jgi:S1-C subfamily serine protease